MSRTVPEEARRHSALFPWVPKVFVPVRRKGVTAARNAVLYVEPHTASAIRNEENGTWRSQVGEARPRHPVREENGGLHGERVQ